MPMIPMTGRGWDENLSPFGMYIWVEEGGQWHRSVIVINNVLTPKF
jgi:hypothetical protein